MTDKIIIVKGEGSHLPDKLAVVVDVSVPPHVFILRTENHEVIVDCKNGTMQKKRRLKFEPLPSYGDHMTWEDFCEGVATSGLTDYDGSGTFATATQVSNIDVPMSWVSNKIHHGGEDSDIAAQKLKPPHDWATHVVWFNK